MLTVLVDHWDQGPFVVLVFRCGFHKQYMGQ
jgi:hypothetical protein